MRKIKLIFFIILAITMMTSGIAFANPGWGDCTGCHASPTVQEFSIPDTYDSLTFPIYSVVAHDTDPSKLSKAGVAGYMITESDTVPSAAGPGWMINPPDNYTLNVPGIKTLYAWAKDTIGNVSESLSAVVEIVIPEPNQPPVANAGPTQNVDEGSSVTLNGGKSSDPDNNIALYYWEQIDGPPVTLSDANDIRPTFDAPAASLNDVALTFSLTVTDDAGAVSSDTCIVNVFWVNEAPVANAGPDQNVDEESSVTLNGANSNDPDNNIAFYYWEQTSGPAVTLSDDNDIRPSFAAPVVGLNGVALTFRLTVTDDEAAESTDTCIVNVSWVNEAPSADAGANQTVDEGVVVTLDGSNSSDADDGIASYMWREVGKTSVTLSGEDTATPTFTTPFVDLKSISLTFELTVADRGGLKSTDTSVVNVSWVNEAPTAEAGPDQTVDEGDTVTLDASNSSDPDDGIASYMWKQTGAISAISVTLSNPTAVKPTFEAPAPGGNGASLTFQVTVTDKDGLRSTDTCIVNINAVENTPVNEAPTADAGTNQTVDEGDTVTLDASKSSDPDDGIKSYMWAQTGTASGVSVTLSDPAAVQPTFAAPMVGVAGASMTFQVTVTDISGLQSSDTCIVNVNGVDTTPANQAPTADAGVDQTVEAGNMVTLDGSNSSDPDGVIASYMWKQTAGMSVTLSSPAAAKPTFECPVVGRQGGSLDFQITVTDIDGLQATDTCVVKINAADIPDGGETPTGEPREKLQAVREDLMAMAKDGEFLRRARKKFSHSVKRLFKAAVFFEKGKIKNVSKEIEKAIREMKKAAELEQRNSALKSMCKEFIHDLKKVKAEIKEEVKNHDDDHDDDDHDHDDDDHHDDDDDHDDDDHDD